MDLPIVPAASECASANLSALEPSAVAPVMNQKMRKINRFNDGKYMSTKRLNRIKWISLSFISE